MCWYYSKVPGQKFVDAVDRMIGDALQDMSQIEFRIKAVELRGAEQGVDSSRNDPTEIRDHALSLLFAIYAVRSREAARLQFSDIGWKRDRIVFTRSKEARRHEFPLLPEVGTAIIRYLKEARPKSSHQQIFLTAIRRIGPLSHGAIQDGAIHEPKTEVLKNRDCVKNTSLEGRS
jgi:integrase